jgi:hypothetical protein
VEKEHGGVGAHREGSWPWRWLWFRRCGGPPAVALGQEAKGESGEALHASLAEGDRVWGRKAAKGLQVAPLQLVGERMRGGGSTAATWRNEKGGGDKGVKPDQQRPGCGRRARCVGDAIRCGTGVGEGG